MNKSTQYKIRNKIMIFYPEYNELFDISIESRYDTSKLFTAVIKFMGHIENNVPNTHYFI